MSQTYTGFAFDPRPAATVSLNASVASTAVQFNNTALNGAASIVLIWNSGTEIVFIEFGSNDEVTASETASMPIPPSVGPLTFRCMGASWLAGRTHANTSKLYITPGGST